MIYGNKCLIKCDNKCECLLILKCLFLLYLGKYKDFC